MSRKKWGLVQCRTGHAFIGKPYRQCAEGFQTRAHVLRDCEQYEEHRDVLRKFSPTMSIPDILATQEGIEALTKFLGASGAFTETRAERGR
ncbi:hypothetical protein FB45DRAFT_837217 [Roridomyces roridus]|uniref:Uncharacterized protein n=1 Tax=Roridomyces roridus TaxID=1738132 RepID=A0AAD7BJI7_9AGAR|nr:hypothetical protein FB45DRAFT_837217 [Roridomyces roridus]